MKLLLSFLIAVLICAVGAGLSVGMIYIVEYIVTLGISYEIMSLGIFVMSVVIGLTYLIYDKY